MGATATYELKGTLSRLLRATFYTAWGVLRRFICKFLLEFELITEQATADFSLVKPFLNLKTCALHFPCLWMDVKACGVPNE